MNFGITSHRGIRIEDLAATYYLNSSITKDHIGAAVSIDPATDFTVGLIDGGRIHGVLQSFEDRVLEGGIKTGAVNPTIRFKFAYTGTAPTRGGHVVSNGAGGVKVAGAGAGENATVVAVDTTAMTCEVLIVGG